MFSLHLTFSCWLILTSGYVLISERCYSYRFSLLLGPDSNSDSQPAAICQALSHFLPGRLCHSVLSLTPFRGGNTDTQRGEVTSCRWWSWPFSPAAVPSLLSRAILPLIQFHLCSYIGKWSIWSGAYAEECLWQLLDWNSCDENSVS